MILVTCFYINMLCQTGLVSFSKVDISRTTDTWQVPVVLLILAFENETKPVWHSSEVASVNTHYKYSHVATLFSIITISWH